MPVMAVVTQAEEVAPLVRWGARFAQSRFTDLIVLHATRASQEQALVPVDLAVEAMREGAADFVSKPFSMGQLRTRLEKLYEVSKLREQHGQKKDDVLALLDGPAKR